MNNSTDNNSTTNDSSKNEMLDSTPVEISSASWETDQPVLKKLREVVFMQEQNVSAELEWDGEDENAKHFLAYTPDGKAVATARLLKSGQIGRMAVLKEFRERSIGSQLLSYIINVADGFTTAPLFLHAQTQAIDFYARHGFEQSGSEFMDADIPHIEMRYPTVEDQGSDNQPSIIPSLRTAELGTTHHRFHLGNSEIFEIALMKMLNQTHRHFKIFCADLNPSLFDTLAFRDALSAFARKSRFSEIQILIQSKHEEVKGSHRLVELSKRMPSKIEIKTLTVDDHLDPRCFCLADRDGILLSADFKKINGYCNFYSKNEVTNLTEEFTRLWDLAAINPEFQRLSL